ncbi:DUF805 domain-containing protein [Flavobacterium panacagri]|uniref:DUF805 domain-containing protein n=1 Tax=Flavobacterium panacagri TaxID=3034146 RepID=UPI003EBF7E1A
MKHVKNIFFFSTSFTEKAGRTEYGIYLLFNLLMLYLVSYLNQNINLDNDKILYLFYICLIILLTFVPMQAVTARRLRDLNANSAFIVFNFIPILNIAFIIFLIFTEKRRSNIHE